MSSGMSPATVQEPPCPRFASSWLHHRQLRSTRARVRARGRLLRSERALFGRLGDPGDPKRVCALVLLIAADREKRPHCSKMRASELVKARSGEKQPLRTPGTDDFCSAPASWRTTETHGISVVRLLPGVLLRLDSNLRFQ